MLRWPPPAVAAGFAALFCGLLFPWLAALARVPGVNGGVPAHAKVKIR